MASKSSVSTVPVPSEGTPLENTPLDAIPSISSRLHATFASHKTKDIEYRLVQLRRLYWGLVDYEAVLIDALRRDLGKPPHESLYSELDFTRDDVMFLIRNLRELARDEPIDGFPLPQRVFGHHVRKQPLGPVLIIGTYNFPVLVNVQPLAGAIAAGCPAVLKASEVAPATAAALQLLIEDRLDRDAYAVVNGGAAHVDALLACGDGDHHHRWGKIAFTGGCEVGRLIARRAAETLTPCLLELGGVNPAVVTRHADPALAARRLLWSITLNAGQVCMRPNYVLVERAAVEPLVEALRRAYAAFFPDDGGARKSEDYARIINAPHFARIRGLLDRTTGKVVMGGAADEGRLFIEPTVVVVDDVDDPLMREEAFGPLMALLAFDSLDEAIGIVNKVSGTPLALSAFGNTDETERILAETISGGASINDSGIHGSLSPAPFGGVGSSGTGAIRGRASFETFTHRRTVARLPSWAEQFLRLRYLPFSPSERLRSRMLFGPSVDFDRDGRPVRGLAWWTGRTLRLGGAGAGGILFRWFVVLLGIAVLRGARPESLLARFEGESLEVSRWKDRVVHRG